MRYFLAMLLCTMMPAISVAKSPSDLVQFKIAPTQLRPDKAYFLFRSNRAKSGLSSLDYVFLRTPTETEIEAYYSAKKIAFEKDLPRLLKNAEKDPKYHSQPNIEKYPFVYEESQNIFSIDSGDFLEAGENRTFLIEIDPGIYIIYGASSANDLLTCNCLGSVKFDAQAGIITNLGSFYLGEVSKESNIPQLEDNLGKSMGVYNIILGQAVVPATPDTQVPQSLKSFPLAFAEYEAVGPFLEPGAVGINRLAPIPGILGYDRGKAMDLKAGKIAK